MKFLENILAELKRAGIVASQARRGRWLLAGPVAVDEISVADIIRAVEGPLADVRGVRPDELEFGPTTSVPCSACGSRVRANLRTVLEHVTLADLRAGVLPVGVDALADAPGAWSH